MELIFIALAIYGALHAGKNGVKVARASSALARTSATAKVPKGSPKSIMNDTRRRATAAWWAREAANGFPATLSGMKQGWHAHQAAAARHEADSTASRARMLAEVARHRARTQAAQAKIDAAKPPAPTVQPPAPAGRPGRPVMQPPPARQPARPVWAPPPISQTAGNQTASTQAAGGNGQPVTTPDPIDPAAWAKNPDANCTDPDCPYCHAPSGSNGSSGQPSGQPSASPTGGNPMSDLTYDGILGTCDAIKNLVEQAVNDQELVNAEQMADQMGPALPDDSESLGAAGDLVTALQAVKAAQHAASEAAQHLRDTVEKNHGAANEAAKATGHMAERDVHATA